MSSRTLPVIIFRF